MNLEKMDRRFLRFSKENYELYIETNLEQGTDQEHKDILDEDERSFASKLGALPAELKSCLDYCFMLRRNNIYRLMDKESMVQVLVAEGVIQERAGEIMEDVANDYIHKLVDMGMLQVDFDWVEINEVAHKLYEKFCIQEMQKDDISKVSVGSDPIVHVFIYDDGKNLPIPPNFYNLPIRSLFINLNRSFDNRPLLPEAYLRSVFHEVKKFLRVLHLSSVKIERLPDEVGDLVHLRYLSLSDSGLKELPESIGGLRNLQTFDIRGCYHLKRVPSGILNLVQLRHLMCKAYVRFPSGTSLAKLKNPYTLTGLYAGGGIASELSSLTQLRNLGIVKFSEDHATHLLDSIMKMDGLQSLSLQAEGFSRDPKSSLLPYSLALFSPPPSLQDVSLEGVLVEMPNWIGSMHNLTTLRLYYSCLYENPTSFIQFLPQLKQLTLWDAYNAKRIGKEFFGGGGFLKLEYLNIYSNFLVEWIELEDGALPNLKHLRLYCSKLMFLPEGLQNLSTLQILDLSCYHPDLERRLSSTESYKIQHIPQVDGIFED